MAPFFCLWNPESPRAVSFSGAVLARLEGMPAAMSWAAFLQGEPLPEPIAGQVVRIDSPGRNWEVEKRLLSRGATRETEEGFETLTQDQIESLEEDPGKVIASRQHYRGFQDALAQIQRHFEGGPEQVNWMQHPEDIAVMCDKAACHARLSAAGVSVPAALGVVAGFEDLMARMDAAGRNRVFLKLCHGSSASGTVALERSRGRIQAFSTARMSEGTRGTILQNWRAVTRYADPGEIRRLVDAVCRQRALAELWLPKAGWRARRFDVRIVVIGGRARHIVARLACGPFTNLQFGALRAPAEELREHLGQDRFTAMCEEAERAMACFPRSLYGGVDVMLDAGRHRPYILEVNAFGDLLPSVRHDGLTTYESEISEMLERCQTAGGL